MVYNLPLTRYHRGRLHSAYNDLRFRLGLSSPKQICYRLQVVHSRALRLIASYDWYTRIQKMHSDTEILKLKSDIKCFALQLCVSAKLS